ncbi:MAG: 50S ribosomal protein L21 [Candidatus Liptonbacteria bacterium]|nr:50S ribosomal protein L21 [Candidatus Liptonbacteria bacterium]
MSKFAVIQTGGKQYRVAAGDKLRVEKLSGAAGDPVTFDKVLLTADDGEVAVGTPFITGATVTGKIVAQARDKKKIIFRYHSKTRYRKKKGHRQPVTEVAVVSL